MRGARGSSFSRSTASVVCSDSASAGLMRWRGKASNTRGSPTVENTRFLCPMAPSEPSRSMASSTFSRLCAGSPMPMNTTFFTARMRRASTTCATISALPSWRIKPSRPVMQNTQPTAQPSCVDTHSPPRGSSTLSTVCPSASATSSRDAPSSPGCSDFSVARPSSIGVIDGSALRTASGKKCSAGRGPPSSGSRCVQARNRRASWQGLAPRSRNCWRRVSIRMRGRQTEENQRGRL